MNNTIPNVPRELLENIVLCYNEGEFELGTLAAECHALLSAPSPADHVEDARAMVAKPSPAGVDGLEVVAWRIGFPNNSGYKVYEQRQPWAYEQYGVPSVIAYEVQELCRLSDAQAIIDGLRGEVAALQADGPVTVSAHSMKEFRQQRDQQAQRIAELEGLLLESLDTLESTDDPIENNVEYVVEQISNAVKVEVAEVVLYATRQLSGRELIEMSAIKPGDFPHGIDAALSAGKEWE